MMLTFLQQYLQIPTAYPKPEYEAAVKLFEKQAAQDGLLSQKIVLPSGNPVLIITLQGTDASLSALALNHHMDVVPAENDHEWAFPPFAGVIHNGVIYGRGAQDCKSLGVMQYVALKQLQVQEEKPARTIHLIMVPDEERGGFCGTKEFITHPVFQSLNIGYMLDEGFPSGKKTELYIKIDERTPLQIRITSQGSQAHASGLLTANCTEPLVDFLYEVIRFQEEQRKKGDANCQPGTFISMHITSLITDTQILNVIPGMAQATIDMRIPSSVDLSEGITIIEKLLQKYPQLTYAVVATSKERCLPTAIDSYFYRSLADVVEKCGLLPKPFAFEATTDARFYASLGIETIGFTPLTSTPLLHATDESIEIEDFEQGIRVLYSFLHSFCVKNSHI